MCVLGASWCINNFFDGFISDLYHRICIIKFSYEMQKLYPAHLWHTLVKDYQVEFFFFKNIECFSPAPALGYVQAERLEHTLARTDFIDEDLDRDDSGDEDDEYDD